MDPKLTEFVVKKREEGLSDKEIEVKLASVGWDENDVKRALAYDEDVPLPPSKSEKNFSQPGSINKDVNMWVSFQHVLMFIALYVMSVSLMLAIGTLINQRFPANGVVRAYYTSNYDNQALRWYLSALIVSFPIFALLFIITGRRIIKNPAERYLDPRKKAIYMTLIGAFIILLWALIRTVYTLLEGNINLNFTLHLLNKIIIFGSMFGYFLYDVKRSSVND